MGKSLWRLLGVSLGGIAILAAACAPAAGPTPTPKVAEPAPTVAAPLVPGAGGVVVKPSEEQKPAAAETLKTSVNGIPLEKDAVRGGTLIFAHSDEGATFNPWEEAAGVSFRVQNALTNEIVQFRTWGNLEDYKNQAYWEIHPDLAKSWEQSPDGLTWTFKFFDGVKWSDGKPFTCADAKWMLDTIRTGQGLRRSPRAIHFLTVKEVSCPDALTMVVSMTRPRPNFVELLGFGYHQLFPKHIYENNLDLLRNEPAKAGTGPFVIKDRIPGEKVVYARREDYFNKPFPYLDGLELRLLNAQAQIAGIRAGRVDLGGTGYSWQGAQAKTLIAECADCQVFPPHVHTGFTNVVHVNHQRAPWNTPEIKDALSLAMDRNKIVQVRYQGFGLPPTAGAFVPGTFWAMPYEQVKQIPGYNIDDPEGNKEKARKLLAAAGYKPGELALNFRWWNSGGTTPPVNVIEDYESVGFKVTSEPLETSRAYDSLSSGDFNVQEHGFFLASADPDWMLYEHFYTGSDRNYGRYSRADVDKLIDEMSATLDPELRRQRAWNVGEILLRDQAKIIGAWGVYQPIFGSRVRGVMPGNVATFSYGPLHRHEHTWLAKK